MIKNVLIPENIGSYYIFSKRIIGFDLGKTHIRVVQLKLTGTKCIVERWFEQALPAGSANTYDERATQTIQALLKMVDPYDAIHTLIPSSLVIFKNLKMPFSAYNKIKMIIDFEVEPLLPFALSDAIIDFIITKKTEDDHSELLVAAVQKQHIEDHLQLFASAGVNPALISVDFFSLYGLYKKTASYAKVADGVTLIDIGSHETSIAYINDGQLKSIRTLPKGTDTIAKVISSLLKVDTSAAIEILIRFGLNATENPSQDSSIVEAFAPFLDEINFTLKTFLPQSDHPQPMSHIYLLGSGSTIHNLTEFIHTKTGVACELLQINTIIEGCGFSVSHKNSISNMYLMGLGAAASSQTIASFNLRQKEFSPSTNISLFYKQMAIASTFFILLFSSLGLFYFVETGNLSSAANQAEQETVEILHEQFKKIPVGSLDSMVEEAQDEIKKEEKLWSVFSPNRTSMLQYLLELTNKIDRDALKFSIDKLHITDNTMKITAHVKDYEALKLLEKELRQSKLFSYVEPQNDPDFTMLIKLIPNA